MTISISNVPSGRYLTTRLDPHRAAQTAPSASIQRPSNTPASNTDEVANVRSLLNVPDSWKKIVEWDLKGR